MQIDLFTFVAQIVNFIILMVLLRAFLYKPVLNAMDERERKIAERLEEAEEKREQAEEEAQHYQEQRQQIDEERRRILGEAQEEAKEQREQMLNTARDEVEEEKSSWYAALERQKEEFLQNLRERASQQVVNITRRLLSDLADAQLERQIVRTFTGRLSRADEKDHIETALAEAEELTISSAFTLSDEMRDEIETALHEQLDRAIDLNYQQDEGLIAGIRLHNPKYELSWSIDDYLYTLEESIRETLTFDKKKDEEQESQEKEVETV